MSYMSHFFSCRSCSTNFSRHVQSLGYLPRSGDAAVLWLWAAHNLANSLLDGDMTEDPTRPKIQWPDNINCPRCRLPGDPWSPLVLHNGQFWNQAEVLRYIKQVYDKSNIVINITIGNTNTTLDQLKTVLILNL